MTVAGSWFVVEDDTERARAWKTRRAELERGGRAIAPLEILSPVEAIERARSDGSLGPSWSAADVVLLDCWDRDLPEDGGAGFDTVFFALDVLHELRASRARGEDVPRVVAFSRAMVDPLVRAALAEFALPRREVRVAGGDPVRRWRIDVEAAPHGPEAVLWAMYDVETLMRHLVEVLAGERVGALRPPPPGDRVFSDFLATSCLASFHHEVRRRFPDLWRRVVLGGETVSLSYDERRRKALNRLGRRYLEVNPARGCTYHGLLHLARQLAQPAPISAPTATA